jgi:adenosylcobinamide-GDP ribazoletransferase
MPDGSPTDGPRLALTLLTVLPVRGPDRPDRRSARQAVALAPAVGLLLGLVAAAVLAGLDALTTGPPLLPAAAGLAVLALLTRGLHLDGLADLADGLGSYAGAERARAIMKQPDVGALGLATVVLVLLVQAGALVAATSAGRGPAALVLASVVGRLAVTAACTPATPAASPAGLGALVAGTVPPALPLVQAPAAAVLAGAAAVVLGGGVVDAARPVLAVLAALLVARGLRRHAVRRLGGLTGDVLGALVETATTTVLVVMALGA